MHNTLTIARRQLASYFNSPVAYIVVCLVLIALGVFFWTPFFQMGVAQVRDMFNLMSIILVFAVPAMTMGLMAEEKRTGTIELLITMPVRDSEVILGKYLGVLGLFFVLLLVTMAYPLSVSSLGDLDWGPVLTGYLGMFLQGAALLGLGLMVSSWTSNQLIAFFVALILCVAFWMVDRFLPFLPTAAASVIEWLSFDYHFQSMARGVIDTRDVLYFLSICVFTLMLAFRALESRRWS